MFYVKKKSESSVQYRFCMFQVFLVLGLAVASAYARSDDGFSSVSRTEDVSIQRYYSERIHRSRTKLPEQRPRAAAATPVDKRDRLSTELIR